MEANAKHIQENSKQMVLFSIHRDVFPKRKEENPKQRDVFSFLKVLNVNHRDVFSKHIQGNPNHRELNAKPRMFHSNIGKKIPIRSFETQ